MIVRGADIAKPSLGIPGLLSDQAKALYPQIDTKCLGDLSKPDSFGGIAPANLFRSDANLAPLVAELNANDPEDLKVPGPIQIEQGKADTTVFPTFTDTLVERLRQEEAQADLQDLRRARPRRRRDQLEVRRGRDEVRGEGAGLGPAAARAIALR